MESPNKPNDGTVGSAGNSLMSLNWNRAPINTVQDYEFCRNAKLYLKQRAESKGMHWSPKPTPIVLEAMKASGYATWDKFRSHCLGWHDLRGPIPRRYADFIGVDLAVLEAVVEFDREDYRKALSLVLLPKCWTVRLMSVAYRTEQFPEELTTEQECIEHILKDPRVRGGLTAWINYLGLKVVCFSGGKMTGTGYHWPKMTGTKHTIVFSSDGREIGVMRIG